MEKENINVFPPCYARGTPVINPRDGPPMALSDKPLFAIREGPSARGKPLDKICSWLAFLLVDADRFEERSGVRSVVAAVDFDLSARAASRRNGTGSDNVKMNDDVKMDKERSAEIFDADRSEEDAVRFEERSGVRSVVAAVDFDLSARAAPDNVKIDNEERSANGVVVAAGDFDLSACNAPDNVKIDDEERSGVRSVVAAVDFDLSACEAPDNVKIDDEERSANGVVVAAVDFDLSACEASRRIGTGSDNVKMKDDVKMDEERSAEIFDADRSEEDAVRSEERSADDVDFDLSAYAASRRNGTGSDNVKMNDEKIYKQQNEIIWNMNHCYRGITSTFLIVVTTGASCSLKRRSTSIFCTCMINISYL